MLPSSGDPTLLRVYLSFSWTLDYNMFVCLMCTYVLICVMYVYICLHRHIYIICIQIANTPIGARIISTSIPDNPRIMALYLQNLGLGPQIVAIVNIGIHL